MNTNETGDKIRVLTIKQAAQAVDGLSEYRIRQLCRSGELPCIRAGKKYLISEHVLLEYIFQLGKPHLQDGQ